MTQIWSCESQNVDFFLEFCDKFRFPFWDYLLQLLLLLSLLYDLLDGNCCGLGGARAPDHHHVGGGLGSGCLSRLHVSQVVVEVVLSCLGEVL